MLRTGPRLPYNPGCMQGKCLLCCRNWTWSAKYQEKGIQVGGSLLGEVSAPRKVRRSQGALPLHWYRGHTIWVFAATFLTGPLNCEVGRCSSWNQRHLPCEQMGLSGLWDVLRQLVILLHYKRPGEVRTDEGQRAGGAATGGHRDTGAHTCRAASSQTCASPGNTAEGMGQRAQRPQCAILSKDFPGPQPDPALVQLAHPVHTCLH